MGTEPWYRRTLRWAQTNLVEIDPCRYDEAWWRAHWRETRIQGVIVNAGGIVAYYPSRFPLHHRAVRLDDRDLFGEITRAAREEGLTVVARMDSNRVADDFYREHPDWICVDADGKPYRQADKYVTCINSPYYEDYLPRVMEEIIERSRPDGFTDNSWAGLPRSSICYCEHCKSRFLAYAGVGLPTDHGWDDERYRLWVRWNYQRRTEVWEFNNRITMAAGGEDCRWIGMVSGDVLDNCDRFIDVKQILSQAPIVMLDHQRRNGVDGFDQNTEAGKRLHGVAGWDKLIPESTPQYQLGSPAFRLASMPPAEVRLWSSAGFAGGIQPWWHHIGAMHEDRRQYRTAAPIFSWHEENQDILVDREPQADVGVVWSQANHDYVGRDRANERTLNPYRGVVRALDKAGVTHLPVHADDIAALIGAVKVLILPNLAAMSEAQIEAVEAFAAAGGSLIATGETSLCSEYGDSRGDYALAGLFGVHRGCGAFGGEGTPHTSIEVSDRHTYMRLSPELRAGAYGPCDATAPKPFGERHPVLAGLADTDTLAFGGYLPVVEADDGVEVLATFIPDFPIYPPETSWMRQPRSSLPTILARAATAGGKLLWFAADLDRCYARDEQFEHAMIIANAVRWALGDQALVTVEGGSGFVTPTLYRQDRRQILHLNNRLVTARVPGRQNALLSLGPIRVALKQPTVSSQAPGSVSLRVSGATAPAAFDGTKLVFEVNEVVDHEVVVVDWD